MSSVLCPSTIAVDKSEKVVEDENRKTEFVEKQACFQGRALAMLQASKNIVLLACCF